MCGDVNPIHSARQVITNAPAAAHAKKEENAAKPCIPECLVAAYRTETPFIANGLALLLRHSNCNSQSG
jgi:hypothetical protein